MVETSHVFDEPTHLPEDPVEEEARLVRDAVSAGIDPDAAVELAKRAAVLLSSQAEALRAVDRRIASGHSLEEAEAILLDAEPA